MLLETYQHRSFIKQTGNIARIEALAYEKGALLWLRSQGDDVKVTYPGEMAKELRKSALKVAALYANK